MGTRNPDTHQQRTYYPAPHQLGFSCFRVFSEDEIATGDATTQSENSTRHLYYRLFETGTPTATRPLILL